MKQYNINDNIKFGKNSGKSISWLLNNKGDYLDWCFKNIKNFIITNNDELIQDHSYKINNLELENKKNHKYIDYLKDNYFLLEKQLNKYKQKEPVFYDKSNKKFYNCFLDEINDYYIDNEWGQIETIYSENRYGNFTKDLLSIKYKEISIDINIHDLFLNNKFFKKVEYTKMFNDKHTKQMSSSILRTFDNKVYVITNGELDLNITGEELFSGSTYTPGGNNCTFEHYYTAYSYIYNEEGYNNFVENQCQDIHSDDESIDNIPF